MEEVKKILGISGIDLLSMQGDSLLTAAIDSLSNV